MGRQRTGRRLRDLRVPVPVVAVVCCVAVTGALVVPAAPVRARPGVGGGADPVAAVEALRSELRAVEAESARLVRERARAVDVLGDERAELAARVAVRRRAAAAVDEADRDVAAAALAVGRATSGLRAATRRLDRVVAGHEVAQGRLQIEAREAYKEASGRLIAAAVALNTMMAEDDPAQAVRTADRVSQLADDRAAQVRRISGLAHRMGRAHADQASLLLVRHHDHGLAVDRARDRRAELVEQRRQEQAQEDRVADAERTVRDLEAAHAAAEDRHGEIRGAIAAWDRHLAALRTTTMRAAVPSELARYGNGRIPAGALTPIGVGHHRLWAPAAGAFKALRAAAAADGIRIGVTDSYRSLGAQVTLVGQKGLYAQGGLAARPGSSEHGWGLAVDLDLDAAALRWMRTHAGRYGFVENTPREPWHWVFTARP